MAKIKNFKPLSIKGTHKEKMTDAEKKNFDWGKWNEGKLQNGGFENPKANEMAKRQRFEKVLKDQSKIRDEAQKEINKKVSESDGEWRTIKGRKVFIRKGESPTEAIARSLGNLTKLKKLEKKIEGVRKHQADIDRKKKYFL